MLKVHLPSRAYILQDNAVTAIHHPVVTGKIARERCVLVREQGGHYLLSEGRSSLTVSSSSGAMYVAHVTSAIRGYLMENAIMQKA